MYVYWFIAAAILFALFMTTVSERVMVNLYGTFKGHLYNVYAWTLMLSMFTVLGVAIISALL